MKQHCTIGIRTGLVYSQLCSAFTWILPYRVPCGFRHGKAAWRAGCPDIPEAACSRQTSGTFIGRVYLCNDAVCPQFGKGNPQRFVNGGFSIALSPKRVLSDGINNFINICDCGEEPENYDHISTAGWVEILENLDSHFVTAD